VRGLAKLDHRELSCPLSGLSTHPD
jgi:hypothetical protein